MLFRSYVAVLTDMANSLKSQGFKNIIFLGDSGGNGRGMSAAAENFNNRWKGEGGVMAAHIAEYYNYADVEKFERLEAHEHAEALRDQKILEKLEDRAGQSESDGAFAMALPWLPPQLDGIPQLLRLGEGLTAPFQD